MPQSQRQLQPSLSSPAKPSNYFSRSGPEATKLAATCNWWWDMEHDIVSSTETRIIAPSALHYCGIISSVHRNISLAVPTHVFLLYYSTSRRKSVTHWPSPQAPEIRKRPLCPFLPHHIHHVPQPTSTRLGWNDAANELR